MKRTLQYLRVVFVSALLITGPALVAGCQSAPLTTDQQAEQDAALAAGDEVEAERIQDEANTAQVKGVVGTLLSFLPVPDGQREVVGGALAAIGSTFLFERPRKHYLNAVKAIGQSVVEINPLGSKMAPGQAVVELGNALRSMGAAVGLKHTDDAIAPPKDEPPVA